MINNIKIMLTNEKYDKYISACNILDIDPKDVEQTEQNEAYGCIKNKYRRARVLHTFRRT